MNEQLHIPAMENEVMELLNLKPGMVVVDCTVGMGAHAEKILSKISPLGRLVCIDKDEHSLALAKTRLAHFKDCTSFLHADFRYLDKALNSLDITGIDAVFFDLGISSFQLGESDRGFSFIKEGPLDMRMDKDAYISAYDLVNNLSIKELSGILRNFGEERWHQRIAKAMIKERINKPISTTHQLVNVIMRSVPHHARYGRIHPATRTFQALRIAVNRELEALQDGLEKGISLLKVGARICVIAFHSLEDRIVKRKFLSAAHNSEIKIITSKPLTASKDEIQQNPRSRSAKLRCAERIK
ncbi:MAG: 16S rRNA (cytosine(1402)-N(4))-methyltransferase RsmH [Candidatus Gygaella obscura]|nr:16S rRNA (cytosine(1402)-N(4))-methyltransferase RsmH [Candidatus Gygaella obscura]